MKHHEPILLGAILWALYVTAAGAAPIDVPMIDDTRVYTFEGRTRIDLDDPVFDSRLSQRTGALWFKAADIDPLQMLYEEGGRINGLNIFLDQGQIHVGAWANRSGQWLSLSTTANQWHHVAYVYDQGQFALFYDGVESQSVATRFSRIPSHSGANGLGGVNGWTLIGNAASEQLGASAYYTGFLAGVGFDRSALNAVEVAALADRTNPVPLPPAALLFGSGLAGLLLVTRRTRRSGGPHPPSS